MLPHIFSWSDRVCQNSSQIKLLSASCVLLLTVKHCTALASCPERMVFFCLCWAHCLTIRALHRFWFYWLSSSFLTLSPMRQHFYICLHISVLRSFLCIPQPTEHTRKSTQYDETVFSGPIHCLRNTGKTVQDLHRSEVLSTAEWFYPSACGLFQVRFQSLIVVYFEIVAFVCTSSDIVHYSLTVFALCLRAQPFHKGVICAPRIYLRVRRALIRIALNSYCSFSLGQHTVL